MIVCPRCSKENQDHYKFCLGCGAELPRDAAQPKSFTAPTPPAGVPAANPPAPQQGGGFSAAATVPESAPTPVEPMPRPEPAPAQPAPVAQPQPAAQAETLPCPQCGNSVPKNFKFCGSCGFDMTSAQTAAAVDAVEPPQPVAMDTMATPMATPGAGANRGSLVLIRPDGTEGEAFPLSDTTVVGREAAGPFASDSYLSPQHAEFAFGGAGLTVRDLNSLNGVYMRIAADAPVELKDGSIFRIGQEILRFEKLAPAENGADGAEQMGSPNPGYVGRVRLVIGREGYGNTYPVPATGMHLGRERGDIIFPEDGYVSGLHCRVHEEGGKIFLTDVGSSNGTFVRIEGQSAVDSGALLLMGQQLFRVEF